MSRVDTLRSDIARLVKKGATLTKDLAKHRDVEQKATATATRKRRDAARARSDASRRMAESAAEREEKKAAAAVKAAADVERKIGDNTDAIAKKQKSLDTALTLQQRDHDRSDDQRRRKEKSHAREVARLNRPTQIRYVEIHPPKPEPLRVLYLTANPHAIERTITKPDGSVVQEGVWLRVDREVRAVKDQIRSSKYRDQIYIEHLPAVTGLDIFNGLNDHRPHVVHFSGHANAQGVLLEDEDGTEHGAGLDFSFLARMLGATDTPPDLLVLNACESLEGAEDLLQTVPVVVGMSDSVNDPAAIAFAAHFYAGIASGQSVGSSLEQAKLKMELLALGDEDLPEARARDDVDLFSHVLIEPPS